MKNIRPSGPEGILLPREVVLASAGTGKTFTLSSRKLGALITIERELGLGEYIERGTPLHGRIARPGTATSVLKATIITPPRLCRHARLTGSR